MLKPIFFLALTTFLGTALPCHAIPRFPDPQFCQATIAYNGPGIPCLLMAPDGSGNPFTQAFDEDGNLVDATITLLVLDQVGEPYAGFPTEDMYLETADDGLVSCNYGVVADQFSDANGITFWVNPQPAGGYSEGPVLVYINGEPLTTNDGLPLKFNSPDINGDLVINLEDVAIFAGDYFGGYHFRSDFHRDGVINLTDIAIMVQMVGAGCP